MTKTNHANVKAQATKILKQPVPIPLDELATLVAEIKNARQQLGSINGAKQQMQWERDEYRGAYLRAREVIENERAEHHQHPLVVEALRCVDEALLDHHPITKEESAMLFGVENRARRQEAANFELGKEIAGMIRHGAQADTILDFLEQEGWCDHER